MKKQSAPRKGDRKSVTGKSFKKEDSRASSGKGGDKPFDRKSKESRSFDKGDDSHGARGFSKEGSRSKPYGTREDAPQRGSGDNRRPKPYGTRSTGEGGRSAKPYGTGDDKPNRNFGKDKGKPYGSRDEKPKRSFDRDDRPAKPYGSREDKPKRSFDRDDRPAKPYGSREDKPKRSFDRDDRPAKPYGSREDKPKRSFDRDDRGPKRYSSGDDKPKRSFDKNRDERSAKPYGKRDNQPKRGFDKDDKKGKKSFDKISEEKPKKKFGDGIFDQGLSLKAQLRKEVEEYGFEPLIEDISKELGEEEPNAKPAFHTPHRHKRAVEEDKPKAERKESKESKRKRKYWDEDEADEDETAEDTDKNMPLNKYIAHSGECSRRDAAELVKQGKVKVNGELVTDPGYRVQEEDKVTLLGKKLTPQKNMVYILLNKPKGFITTTEDPQERKTVMELVANSGVERLYPIGRLDRNTTGLLLMTNDGDLAQKLSHPSYETKKVYQVTLDRAITKADFDKVIDGVELEDGKAEVDALAQLEEKNELGLEIHSGRNRIVRRIFESLGYEVDKLDRVVYAGLTKKNLPRGKWRFLSEQEVVRLKHFKL